MLSFFFRISLRCFEKSFTGESLVNYLIEKNIAADKTEAISYGEDLLQGKKLFIRFVIKVLYLIK